MAFGLGLAADGGFATDTIEEIRAQAIELMTLDNMVDPMADPVRSVLVQRITDKIYQLQQVGLSVWNMMSVNNASGANLDYLASNLGVFRKPGIAQTLLVKITSVNVGAGYSIPIGTRFTTTDGKYTYETLATINVVNNGELETHVRSITNEKNQVIVGDKLVSESYIPQLTDITILNIEVEGTENESDEELRLRLFGKNLSFIGTIPFMLDQLRGIDYLRKVGENHNNTNKTDSDGVPAYSTEFLVLPYSEVAGSSEEAMKIAVAQKIVSFMLPGLPTYGSTSVTIPDYKGKNRTVNFTVVNRVQLEVYFRIEPMEDGTFSDADINTQKQNIFDYINELDIGTDISITKLWGIVSPDAKFDIVDFGVRRVGGSWQKTNLSIGSREAAVIELNNISIGPEAGM
jgi:uncharacterized phage protein gp47/JayE